MKIKKHFLKSNGHILHTKVLVEYCHYDVRVSRLVIQRPILIGVKCKLRGLMHKKNWIVLILGNFLSASHFITVPIIIVVHHTNPQLIYHEEFSHHTNPQFIHTVSRTRRACP